MLTRVLFFSHMVLVASLVSFALSATELAISNKNELPPALQSKVSTWLSHSINAAETTLGPLNQQVLPVKINDHLFTSEAVPWAQVKRGEPDSLVFHIYRYASLNTLKKDWTAYHEIAHLYHPLFDYPDFWLSEGLATYLQNYVMFKSDVISRFEFTQRLAAGLERGRLNTIKRPGQLSNISEEMWRLNAYQRVYWSGAAFFIEAELALIKQQKPRLSQLIQQVNMCCVDAIAGGERKAALEFLTELDRASRSAIFINLYTKYRNRTDFPRIDKSDLSQLIVPAKVY